MKNGVLFVCLIACLIACLGITSCESIGHDFETKAYLSEESVNAGASTTGIDRESEEQTGTNHSFISLKQIFVLGSSDEDQIINLTQEDKFNAHEIIETPEAAEMKYTFLGTEFELVYKNTVRFAASDLCVHVYTPKKSSVSGYFYFNAQNGELVRAWNVPYTADCLTEDSCMKTVSELTDGRLDLSDMELKVKTTYGKSSDMGYEVKSTPGFYACTDDSESLQYYSFYFTQEKNGIKAEKRVTIEFGTERLNYEIITNGDCMDLTYNLSDAEQVLSDFVRDQAQKNKQNRYSFSSLKIVGTEYRQIDGEPYLLFKAEVYCSDSSGQSGDELFVTDVKLLAQIDSAV